MLIAKLYPSGLVTASFIQKKPLSELLEQVPSRPLTYEQQFQLKQVQEFGINEAIRAKQQADTEHQDPSTLTLTNVTNSVTEHEELVCEYFYSVEDNRTRRGSKGITSKGRRSVKDACAILERDYKLSQLAFITLTLPPEYSNIGGKDWAKAARSIKRKLLRRLHDEGLPDELVMVTEIQTERGFKHGDFAHHFHIVFVGRHLGQTWSIPTKDIRRMWQETCEAIAGKIEDTFWNVSVNSRRIEKSVKNYVGKYLTKGCESVKRIMELDPDYEFPPSWYNITNSLKKKVKEAIQTVTGIDAKYFIDWLQSNPDSLLSYQKDVTIKFTYECGGVEYPKELSIGWYGYVSDYETVSDMIRGCKFGIVHDWVGKVA
jgi:hypothetical protein